MMKTKDDLDKKMKRLLRRIKKLTTEVEKRIEEEKRKDNEFHKCFTNRKTTQEIISQ